MSNEIGWFDDGSNDEEYADDLNCEWFITPQALKHSFISLRFTQFQ